MFDCLKIRYLYNKKLYEVTQINFVQRTLILRDKGAAIHVENYDDRRFVIDEER